MDTFFWAGAGTGFTCLMTALGAAVVLFFRREIHRNVQRLFLGFAAGVMIAASVWSLLLPAIEAAQRSGSIGWIPAAGGFSLGIVFLIGVDSILPVLFSHRTRKDSFSRTALLVLAVTLPQRWPWASGSRTFPKALPFPFPFGRKAFLLAAPFGTEVCPVWSSCCLGFWRYAWQTFCSRSCPGFCPLPPAP